MVTETHRQQDIANASQKQPEDQRLTALATWLTQVLGTTDFELAPLQGDASFRRYCRVLDKSTQPARHLMAMDAPPELENSHPFVGVSELLDSHGVRVPHILAHDLAQGFILLEDFGDTLLSTELNDASVDALYLQAMHQLIHLQRTPITSTSYPIPAYSPEKLLSEIKLFDEWFLPKLLDIHPDAATQQMLDETYAGIVEACIHQPQVLVHRDFHCRNLMVLPSDQGEPRLGVIDFQDAVVGAVTYDLASILRDAYVRWTPTQVKAWTLQFLHLQQQSEYLIGVTDQQFLAWFDVMAAQRHLKVLGIFVRLNLRDGKTGYMKDLPLVLGYLLQETIQPNMTFPSFKPFNDFLMTVVLSKFIAVVPESKPLLLQMLQEADPSFTWDKLSASQNMLLAGVAP